MILTQVLKWLYDIIKFNKFKAVFLLTFGGFLHFNNIKEDSKKTKQNENIEQFFIV